MFKILFPFLLSKAIVIFIGGCIVSLSYATDNSAASSASLLELGVFWLSEEWIPQIMNTTVVTHFLAGTVIILSFVLTSNAKKIIEPHFKKFKLINKGEVK